MSQEIYSLKEKQMIEVSAGRAGNVAVSVPGSKSYTHRILVASALSDGLCVIENPLDSEDIQLTAGALKQLGAAIEKDGGKLRVHGTGGRLQPSRMPIYLGNSGTSMRFITALVAIGQGDYVLEGSLRMAQRPIRDLLDGLNQLGVPARSIQETGCPPVQVTGGHLTGGSVSLRCEVSSQYLSGLLLIAPCTRDGLDVEVTAGPVSKPYLDMTVDVMQRLGVIVEREGYSRFRVAGRQVYRAGAYTVEPDASQASYFWAAAAVSQASIQVRGISRQSRQGDVRFVRHLEAMGCEVSYQQDGITVTGKPLRAISVDMADMPDLVPTLAVVAAFAQGTTKIQNVAHLRGKESDRLGCVAAELNRMGIDARCSDSGIEIVGGVAKPATIETYNDHRMAMSFAVAGLQTPGVRIQNPDCVAKSFPHFWQVFQQLYI